MADEPVRKDDGDVACAEQVEMMTDYLEDALPPAAARRLERHLETCDGCTEYLEQMRMIAGSLGGVTEVTIPAEIRDDLVAAFRAFRKRGAPP
jgi:anti-sigma factor RsiW